MTGPFQFERHNDVRVCRRSQLPLIVQVAPNARRHIESRSQRGLLSKRSVTAT
jgi:hypothetical protein